MPNILTDETFGSSISAEDALRVSVIDREVNAGKVLAKWNTSAIEAVNATEQDLNAGKLIVGFYSRSKTISAEIVDRLPPKMQGINLGTNSYYRDSADQVNALIAHISDDEDDPVLDKIIDAYINHSALFLCEQDLSSKCIDKLEDFIKAEGDKI